MTSSATVVLGRVRGGLVVGLAGFVATSWMYLAFVATQMGDVSSVLSMPMTAAWTPVQAALMVAMWAVMMAAMMLPSAVPMVLAYDRMNRGPLNAGYGSTSLFVAGYVVVWGAFAVAAAGLQWLLHSVALVDGKGVVTQGWFAGGLLIGAGIVQFSPGKMRSLGACRTPMGFLMTSWRDGREGALRMGLHHGRLCFGCCWSLMILLFVLGVMNLAWVAVLAIFVLAEKVTRRGVVISMVGGVVLMLWGVVVVLGG
ncbi:MAG: hypothetical protein BMS9Abin20_0191 [Acidimicrobiia bacterium]|nr:MAG: hypothetical protein BMS9Abin20_0191 [Acidimicrobiia bacterium]